MVSVLNLSLAPGTWICKHSGCSRSLAVRCKVYKQPTPAQNKRNSINWTVSQDSCTIWWTPATKERNWTRSFAAQSMHVYLRKDVHLAWSHQHGRVLNGEIVGLSWYWTTNLSCGLHGGRCFASGSKWLCIFVLTTDGTQDGGHRKQEKWSDPSLHFATAHWGQLTEGCSLGAGETVPSVTSCGQLRINVI